MGAAGCHTSLPRGFLGSSLLLLVSCTQPPPPWPACQGKQTLEVTYLVYHFRIDKLNNYIFQIKFSVIDLLPNQ